MRRSRLPDVTNSGRASSILAQEIFFLLGCREAKYEVAGKPDRIHPATGPLDCRKVNSMTGEDISSDDLKMVHNLLAVHQDVPAGTSDPEPPLLTEG